MLRRHLSYKASLKTYANSEPKYLLIWSYTFTATCKRSRAKKSGVSIKTQYPSTLKSLVVMGRKNNNWTILSKAITRLLFSACISTKAKQND